LNYVFSCHWLEYSGQSSLALADSTCRSSSSSSSSSSSMSSDNEHSSDSKYLTNGHSHNRSPVNNSITNGYNTSTKSRSCENNLDACGRKVADELAISSSSLIDLPTPSCTSHADYDNLPGTGHVHGTVNAETTIVHQPLTRLTMTQTASSITGELDQKIREAIDARLKEIDDEFELNRKCVCVCVCVCIAHSVLSCYVSYPCLLSSASDSRNS
jgi:hypothetical protein